MNSSSKRRFAVVTGASSGIGYELAKQFAQNGFDLLITATGATINEAAQDCESLGAKVETVQADLATYDGVEMLYDKILATGRPVDAIALNAGVGVGGEFTKTDLQAELNLIELNVASTVHLAKRVVQDMVSRGAGKILFTSSIVSQMPSPFQAVYAASKAFVHSFSEAIRNRVEGHRCHRHRTHAWSNRNKLFPPSRIGRHQSRRRQEGRPRTSSQAGV